MFHCAFCAKNVEELGIFFENGFFCVFLKAFFYNENLSLGRIMDENGLITPLERWIESNSGRADFSEALGTLVSYACSQWFLRCASEVVSPGEALSRVVLARLPGIPVEKWLENPAANSSDIVAFCERTKSEPLPEVLRKPVSGLLDLRGVQCPANAARSRLVMSGYPCGRVLDIYLDEGSPVENVPAALVADGVKVLSREKNAGFWMISVVKPENK